MTMAFPISTASPIGDKNPAIQVNIAGCSLEVEASFLTLEFNRWVETLGLG